MNLKQPLFYFFCTLSILLSTLHAAKLPAADTVYQNSIQELLEPNHPEIGSLQLSREIPPSLSSQTFCEFTNIIGFVAILNDGSPFYLEKISPWFGVPYYHYHPLSLPPGRKIKNVISNEKAFAAILDDDSLFCWGDPQSGGTTPKLDGKKVLSLASTKNHFAAILKDHSLICWGEKAFLEKENLSLDDSKRMGIDAISLVSNNNSFVALLKNGTLFPWGNQNHISYPPQIIPKNAIAIIPSNSGFTAVFSDYSTLSWNSSNYQTFPLFQNPLMRSGRGAFILPSGSFFTAFLESNYLQCWEVSSGNQESLKIPDDTDDTSIQEVCSTQDASAVLLTNGELYCWNRTENDPTHYSYLTQYFDFALKNPTVNDIITKAISLKNTQYTFGALLNNHQFLIWNKAPLAKSEKKSEYTPVFSKLINLPTDKEVVKILPNKIGFLLLFDDCTASFIISNLDNIDCSTHISEKPLKFPLPENAHILNAIPNGYDFLLLLDNGSLITWQPKEKRTEQFSTPDSLEVAWFVSPFHKRPTSFFEEKKSITIVENPTSPNLGTWEYFSAKTSQWEHIPGATLLDPITLTGVDQLRFRPNPETSALVLYQAKLVLQRLIPTQYDPFGDPFAAPQEDIIGKTYPLPESLREETVVRPIPTLK